MRGWGDSSSKDLNSGRGGMGWQFQSESGAGHDSLTWSHKDPMTRQVLRAEDHLEFP